MGILGCAFLAGAPGGCQCSGIWAQVLETCIGPALDADNRLKEPSLPSMCAMPVTAGRSPACVATGASWGPSEMNPITSQVSQAFYANKTHAYFQRLPTYLGENAVSTLHCSFLTRVVLERSSSRKYFNKMKLELFPPKSIAFP